MGYAIKKKPDGKFTVKDYLTWPVDERWELIDGIAYDMTPSPTARHQRIAGNFYSEIKNRLRDGSCVIFIAPLDVILDDSNVVQPDIFVVCDKTMIKDRIHGAPDLIIEVLSPATSLKDKRDKKALYERCGVREYIIAYPEDLFIERYRLVNEKYIEPDIIGAQEKLMLALREGIDIPLWQVFETEPPKDFLDSGSGIIV